MMPNLILRWKVIIFAVPGGVSIIGARWPTDQCPGASTHTHKSGPPMMLAKGNDGRSNRTRKTIAVKMVSRFSSEATIIYSWIMVDFVSRHAGWIAIVRESVARGRAEAA